MSGSVCRWLLKTLLVLLLVAVPCAARAQSDGVPLYVIERDTLQTRNFVSIVNHETMAVNLGEIDLRLELTSPVPAGKNRTGPFYPAFLEDSLLPDPLFAPLEVAPTKVAHLDRPRQRDGEGGPAFVWPSVALPAGQAVIAQYDNYLGGKDFYHRPEGLDIFGLRIQSRYRAVQEEGGRWRLSLAYTLINDTGGDVSDVTLEIFVPLVRHVENEEDAEDRVLLTADEICSSPDLEVARMTRVDGFASPASGLSALLRIESLPAGGQRSCFVRVVGRPDERAGTLWPILSLRGRSLQPAVWPPTRIAAVPAVREGRFSYLSYNLVMQDSRAFSLSANACRAVAAPSSAP
jgi:hypothetical protein